MQRRTREITLAVVLGFAGGHAALAASVDEVIAEVKDRPHPLKTAFAQQSEPARVLEVLAEYDGPAQAIAKQWQVRALVELDRVDDARALFKTLAPPPPPCGREGPDAWMMQYADLHARVHLQQPVIAARFLATLPPDDGTMWAEAVRGLRAGKQEKEARALERRLLIEAPHTPAARQLAQRLGASGLAERLTSLEDRLARVEALLTTHQNKDAYREAKALDARTQAPAARCRLGYVLGKASRKMRRYRDALTWLPEARTRCEAAKDVDRALRAALLEVHVRSIKGQVRGTQRAAQQLVQRYPDHSYADDALLVAAQVLQRKGRPKEARALYAHMLENFPKGDQASMAAWRLAYADISAGRDEAAAVRLQWILEHPVSRSVEHHRARYWLMRMTKDEAARREHMQALLRVPNFYGWLALDRLRRSDPKQSQALQAELLQRMRGSAVSPELPSSLAERSEWVDAIHLLASGSRDLGEAVLRRLECHVQTGPEALAVATMYHHAGAYPRAQWLLRIHSPTLLSSFDGAHRAAWDIAYSRPFWGEIQQAAGSEKLESLFLLALVREESTFDPRIVSWAGATGLAQLMPPTAIGAYANVFHKRLDLARLTEPKLNLRLGAHVLADGLRTFGSEPLALSAYNGGPGLTQRFVPKRPVSFDRWVESVTVKETRRYIKRVTETWGIYRFLYDRAQPFITLPESVGGPSS